MSEPRSREVARATGIGLATLLLAASNIGSRALGLLRDVALSGLAGASGQTDAYFAAFRIPDLLNHLLIGGALSVAFLPLYTRLQAQESEEAAERLFHTVLGTLLAFTALATLAAWWYSHALVRALFGGFSPDTLELASQITRIVIPAQIFFVAGGVINTTLLARGRFGALALAPLIYNFCIIAVGSALYRWLGIHAFAWGVLVGAVLGPFGAPLIDALRRVPIRLRVAPLDPGFRRYLWVAFPFMVGFSLLTVDEWYHSILGARLAEGSVSHLTYARRVMLVPVGAVGQAIGTAALPALSRLFAEKRVAELNETLEQTLLISVWIAIAIAVGTALLAGPLVALAFQRGRFTPADAAIVAPLLALLAASIPAWIGQQIAVRGFYARGDTWRPMLLGTALVAASFPAYQVLGNLEGVRGLALASVAAMTLNAAGTFVLARRLHGAPLQTRIAGSALRAGAISAAAAAVCSGVLALAVPGSGPLPAPGPGLLRNLLVLVLGGSLYVATVALLVARFGDAGVRGWLVRMAGRVPRVLTRRARLQ